MGCSNPSVITDDEDIIKIIQNIQNKKEILFLEYETKCDYEEVLLISNDINNKYYISFYDGVQNKFELYDYDYDNKVKIQGPTHTFGKKGIHTIKMVIKEKILDFSYNF